MGLTAENMAEKYSITRDEQDEFAAVSYQRAEAASTDGRFKSQIVPLEVTIQEKTDDQRYEHKIVIFDRDEGIRPGTTKEILSELPPVFKVNGTVTAGNSSQTSDAAAAVLIMSKEKADELGMNPDITNVNGGAIALGHPLGCTGAKLTTQLAYEMAERKSRYGLITMCVGFGMGAAALFERE